MAIVKVKDTGQHGPAHRASAARAAIMLLLAATLLFGSGCYVGHFFSWLFAPRHPKKFVPAEYKLKADMLLILPYAGTDILFNNPTASVEVAQGVMMEIARHLSGKVKRVVNPVQVLQFQENNLDWQSMSLVDVGRKFKADKVLYVELTHYSMIEPDSVNLLRGRISARVEVVDATAQGDAKPVYSTDADVIFPPDRPVDIMEASERMVRQVTIAQFAQTVIRKFYDHKEEIEIKVKGRQ
jgi:hypothetical protein